MVSRPGGDGALSGDPGLRLAVRPREHKRSRDSRADGARWFNPLEGVHRRTQTKGSPVSAAKVPAGSGPGAVTAVAQVRSVVWELPRRRCRRPNRGSKVPAPNPPAQSAAPELLPPEAAWPSARHHSSADGRVPTARVGLGTLRPELPVTLTCHKTFPGLPWFAPHEARSLAAGCTEPGAALAAAPQQPEGSPWQGDGAQLPARPGSTELAGEAAAAGWPRLRQCVRPRGPPPLLDCGVGRAPPGGPSGPRSQQRAQGADQG